MTKTLLRAHTQRKILYTVVNPQWKTENCPEEIFIAPEPSSVDWFISRWIVAWRTRSKKKSANYHGGYQRLNWLWYRKKVEVVYKIHIHDTEYIFKYTYSHKYTWDETRRIKKIYLILVKLDASMRAKDVKTIQRRAMCIRSLIQRNKEN